MSNASAGSEEEYYKREEERSMENNTNIPEMTSMFGDSPSKHSLVWIKNFVTLFLATYIRLN